MKRGTVSLERALSKLGLASRSESRTLIREGRVRIDGAIARDPARLVVPERIEVAIDGTPAAKAAPLTILLHKPRGVVTTRSDPDGRTTVYDLLTGVPQRVVPVGRLDLATSGLLLFTNDTRLADWLTDPRSHVPRVYLVTVKGRVVPETAQQIESGVVSRGETLAAAAVRLRKTSARESHLVVTLEEGRNREVRRMFEAAGHEVTRLRRVQFGGLELGDLPPGKWRTVSTNELREAFPANPYPRKRAPSPK